MKILHIVPGTSDVSNGMVVVANLFAREQANAEVIDLNHGIDRVNDKAIDEVWVHGMWLPKEWVVCRKVLSLGKSLVRMTHGSLSPVYLKRQSPLKKRLVSPIEKRLLRHSSRVVATCEAEKGWIQAYLGNKCPLVEVTNIKRFFNLSHKERKDRKENCQLHLLYLGRNHLLKGLEYLETALAAVKEECMMKNVECGAVELRVESSVFGGEKEKVWDWCDVLVLPTLSDNFGLVVAEALERGKRVITTDGAPAWGDGNTYGGRLVYLNGYRSGTQSERIDLLRCAIKSLMQQIVPV